MEHKHFTMALNPLLYLLASHFFSIHPLGVHCFSVVQTFVQVLQYSRLFPGSVFAHMFPP